MKNTLNTLNIDDYLQSYPKNAKSNANELRAFIKHRVGDFNETMQNGKPTLNFDGKKVQFVIHDDHIGFFPGKGAVEKFKKELDNLGCGYNSNAVRFSIHEKLPYNLIENMISYIKTEEKAMENEKKRHIKLKAI